MAKDQKLAAKRGEVGPLDFDPFIDAQDWNVAEFDIAVTDTASGRASAKVKSTNLGKATTVLLDLSPSKRAAHSRHHLAGRRQAPNAGRRAGAPVRPGIPAVPRFQPPPRRTQHAGFPHCAPPFASLQGLWDQRHLRALRRCCR
jgi:hypothetical protein